MSLLVGRGHVHHSRQLGAANNFRYPTFFLHFRCDQEAELQKKMKSQYYGLFSINVKNYLDGDGQQFESAIKKFLLEKCNYHAAQIWFQSYPQQFGYAFNPVSFWFCERQGQLEAVLVEVNNTFGERHFYWIHPGVAINSKQWLRAEKVFHVSPFFPVEGYYQFRFKKEETKTRVDINYHGPDQKLRLATWVTGDLTELSQNTLLSLLIRYGWMTPMITFRIHYQALRLWLKKITFYKKPKLPGKQVSS